MSSGGRPGSNRCRWIPFLAFCAVGLLGSATFAAPAEPLSWLRDYLRADTTNPPGNEERGAAVLAAILRREGIPYQLLASPSGRTSLYARLEATTPPAQPSQPTPSATPDGRVPAILLLHHIDVVQAGPGWSVPAFAGEVRGGRIYGRGAIDCKGLGIAQLAAFVAVHRAQQPRRRAVIFLAVADEETGGAEGTRWLLTGHPELFAGVEAVFNEGGANRAVGDRLFWWGVEIAQKRALWLEVTAHGIGGHGSTLRPRSAIHELVQGLARVAELPLTYRLSPVVRRALLTQAPHHNNFNRASLEGIDRWIDASGNLTAVTPPGSSGLLADTVQITVLDGGSQINVIPAEARAEIDIRLLPDTDSKAFLARIVDALGPQVTHRVLLDTPVSAPSPTDSRLFFEVRRALERVAPVTLHVASGVTDSRYFRERGIAAYGFSPFSLDADSTRGIHAVDESLALPAFERGLDVYRSLLQALVEPSTR